MGAWIDGDTGVGVIVRNSSGDCLKVEGKHVEARCAYGAELMGAWLVYP